MYFMRFDHEILRSEHFEFALELYSTIVDVFKVTQFFMIREFIARDANLMYLVAIVLNAPPLKADTYV